MEESLKPFLDGLELEPRALEALEADFRRVLAELAGNQGLERFRLEYDALFRSLRKSTDNEKRLIKRCGDLQSELASGAAKVSAALRLSEEDQATIGALKREVERAWAALDAARDKEAKSREAAAALRAEVADLTRLAATPGDGSSGGEGSSNSGNHNNNSDAATDEKRLAELTRAREVAERERDAHVEALTALRASAAEAAERLRRVEGDKVALEAEAAALRAQAAEKRTDAEREARRRERLDRDAAALRSALEARETELRAKQLEVQCAEEGAGKLEALVREARARAERAQKEAGTAADKAARLQRELDEQITANAQMLAAASCRQAELRAKEDEAGVARAEAAKAAKAREAAARRAKVAEEARGAAEAERDALSAAVDAAERDVEAARHELAAERRRLDGLASERDHVERLRAAAENGVAAQLDLVRVSEGARRALERQLEGARAEATKAAKAIDALERERQKAGDDACAAAARAAAALDEVRLRESALGELQARVAEGEARLRQQQALYETVRGERNAAAKSLVEARDEIAEARRRARVQAARVEQLSDEVGAKDLALTKEKFERIRADKDKEALRAELDKAKAALAAADTDVTSQRAQLEQLNAVVGEADAERGRQRREYQAVLDERDVLGGALVRRNDELALLYEKVKIQQSALATGQLQYRDRVNEIRLLKITIAELRRQLHGLRSAAADGDALKREVASLGRQLLAERAKARALGEELETPLNVHRWRRLEGSDPAAYEMLQKVAVLQRRLIARTEEVAEKQLLIQEKDALHAQLRATLERAPGPEAAEQLAACQGALRAKGKQLQALTAELGMCQAQIAEYKADVARLSGELADAKRQYFETKRRRHAEQQQQRLQSQEQSQQLASGGGAALVPVA